MNWKVSSSVPKTDLSFWYRIWGDTCLRRWWWSIWLLMSCNKTTVTIQCDLVNREWEWDLGSVDSVPSSDTDLLGHLREATFLLCPCFPRRQLLPSKAYNVCAQPPAQKGIDLSWRLWMQLWYYYYYPSGLIKYSAVCCVLVLSSNSTTVLLRQAHKQKRECCSEGVCVMVTACSDRWGSSNERKYPRPSTWPQ